MYTDNPQRIKFQFLLSVRGATMRSMHALNPIIISILAPRGGSDSKVTQTAMYHFVQNASIFRLFPASFFRHEGRTLFL